MDHVIYLTNVIGTLLEIALKYRLIHNFYSIVLKSDVILYYTVPKLAI